MRISRKSRRLPDPEDVRREITGATPRGALIRHVPKSHSAGEGTYAHDARPTAIFRKVVRVMNDLFREQLLKAGLATKKQAKAAAHEENIARRQRRKELDGAEDGPTAEQVAAQKATEEKRARDRQLNLEREAEARAQALHAQSDELIKQNAIKKVKGNVEYKFADEGKVKRLFVSNEVQLALRDGATGIVWGSGGYHLVPRAIAEKIAERTPDRLILLNDTGEALAPDDPYAEFPVPDDLMW